MSDTIQTPPEGTEEKVETTPEAGQEQETLETPPVEEQPEDKPEGQAPKPLPQPGEPDYKKKFVESQREGILNHARFEQEKARNAQLTTKDTPTDDEMKGIYSNWDELDEGSRAYYRNQRLLEKRLVGAESASQSLAQKLEFEDKLEDFMDTPPDEFKGLKGKESDFKKFAKRKNNLGLPLDVLAKAFLFDIQDDIQPEHTPTKTPGLEKGTGGPRSAPKLIKISGEEAANLRKNNYNEWRRLVTAGVIEEDI